jgi:hypothetical protein
MKRTDLQARCDRPAVRWSVFVLLLGSVLVTPFALAQDSAPAVLTVESKTVPPATKTTISVTLQDVPVPGIASIQGQFSYDPKVLVLIEPYLKFPQIVGGSSVTVFNNTPESGRVRFAATLAGADLEGITSGAFLEFSVEAVGKNGDKSHLTLAVEVLSDIDFNSVPYQVINGVFEIKEAENQLPSVDFSFSPESPTAGQTVQFTDKSKDPDGKIVAWKWNFGDGGTSELQNPTYVYRTPGTFTVTLIVTDDKGGASARLEKAITVRPGTTGVTVTNFPNPAKDKTKFVYGWVLPSPARQATLKIFNIKGELVFSKDLDITKTEFVYDLRDNAGRPLPNGPYFYLVSVTAQDNRMFKSAVGVLSVQR